MKFEFDKQRNRLLKNGRTIDQLTNLKEVQWNIDSVTDHEESYLELLTSKNDKHRISSTINIMNKEHLELGKQLAKFLRIEFRNNHPFEKEMVHSGQQDLDQSDLDFIENH